MLRNASEAEDSAQEATLKAWAKLFSFRPGSDLKSWYLRIIANQCRQTLKSSWRRVALSWRNRACTMGGHPRESPGQHWVAQLRS
jgi:DNA-directed RNA polymerase specialized sigma24 family protein